MPIPTSNPAKTPSDTPPFSLQFRQAAGGAGVVVGLGWRGRSGEVEVEERKAIIFEM